MERNKLTEWLDLDRLCEAVLRLPMVSPREPRMTAASTRRRILNFFMAPLWVSTNQLPLQITGKTLIEVGEHLTTFAMRSQLVGRRW